MGWDGSRNVTLRLEWTCSLVMSSQSQGSRPTTVKTSGFGSRRADLARIARPTLQRKPVPVEPGWDPVWQPDGRHRSRFERVCVENDEISGLVRRIDDKAGEPAWVLIRVGGRHNGRGGSVCSYGGGDPRGDVAETDQVRTAEGAKAAITNKSNFRFSTLNAAFFRRRPLMRSCVPVYRIHAANWSGCGDSKHHRPLAASRYSANIALAFNM